MFSAFKKFGKLGALASSVARAWSPLALWPDGIATPGMWISPRTLTSQWADYLGSTPVATPGTVADSANPVGLALDIRSGAPEVLGPDVVTNGDFAAGATGWTLEGQWTVGSGQASITNASDIYVIYQSGLTAGKTYLATFTISSISAGRLSFYCGESFFYSYFTTVGTHTAILVCGANGFLGVQVGEVGTTAAFDNISFKEVRGNHMLQSTSAARPLASAYDGQTLGPGDTYDGTGYPIAQLYDGVDDGMETAEFAAGTLIDGMDCLIAVRRDSGAKVILGPYKVTVELRYLGNAEASFDAVCYAGAGSPTVWVDNVQLTNGWASELHTAVTVGDWHIVEFRGADLSTWIGVGAGNFGIGYNLNGPRGDIMLYPSTTPTADKDAARQWLADYYGVTLA